MMALTAENAIRPATMSFGLCSNMRMNRPRSATSSSAATRARLDLADLGLALGTLLHLVDRIYRRARHRRQGRDVAGRHHVRRAVQWQGGDHDRPLADPALNLQIAAMHGDQALDDRQAETGALVAALVQAFARLEERIADPREIAGG